VLVAAALVFWVGRYLRRNLAADIAVPLSAAALALFGAHLVRSALHGPALVVALASVFTFLGVFAAMVALFERDTVVAEVRTAMRAMRRKKA
jgi:hypothetical protein